jgi:prepilin-type N-terminal cleavage/methylation domain-containing protein
MISRAARNRQGFTLLELAIALLIIGLLTGGSLAIITSISAQAKRQETAQYMETVRQSLLAFANLKKALPLADVGADGIGDPNTFKGGLPYKDIGVEPLDAWGRSIKYEVNQALTVNTTSCSELKDMIVNSSLGAPPATPANWPKVWDATGGSLAANPLLTAVVAVSSGPGDADGDGSVYDQVSDGVSGGNNITGNPYLRRRPEYSASARFDDLVIYIGAPTLYDWMKCTN